MSSEIFNSASNFSPLNKIEAILLSAPGSEASYGLSMPPEISLFESDFTTKGSVYEARKDHNRMVDEFSKRGIKVFNMREIIGRELAKKQDTFKNSGQLLMELETRALKLHDKYHIGDIESTIEEIEQLFRDDIKSYGEDAAIAINAVLTNCIDHNGKPKEFDVATPPAGNFIFWRDTNHITGDQVRTHNMFYSIRQQEVVLTEIGFKALGINFQKINSKNGGSIEGGDILPVEINGQRYSLIGRAQRTTDDGVESWFNTHKDLWKGSNEGIIPAIVEGPRTNTQDQMHLDTHFQQVNHDSALHCPELSDKRSISFLMKKGSEIVKVDTQKFTDWVEKSFTNVYRASRDEQLKYVANILVDAGETVYITRNDSPDATKFIQEQVSEAVLLDMKYLTQLYGGAHCSTSEIRKR